MAAFAFTPRTLPFMKIATWNVNSLNVRKQHVLDWLAQSGTDVLCLQELKLPDEKFPRADLEAVGYRNWFTGQKTYNGVAILARDTLSVDESDVVRNIPGFDDPQQRVVAATVDGVRIVSAYFPNGRRPTPTSSSTRCNGSTRCRHGCAPSCSATRSSRCSATTTSRRKTATCTTRRNGKARTSCRRRSAPTSRS